MFQLFIFSILLSIVSCQSPTTREVAQVNRPPQYVLLAFDGSKSLPMWEETRAFAKRNDVKFTYFVSGVYFISNQDRSFYAEPRRGLGKSAIGWGGSRQHIQARHQQMVAALNEGHEIASHANGHFDGTTYSPMEWNMELKQFLDIMRNGWELYGRKKPSRGWTKYFDKNLVGFRAPQLGHRQTTINALAQAGYRYDTSKVGKMSYWPQKMGGIWNFPLAGLRINGTNQRTLSMDYNFYVADSNAKKGAPANWARYENQMYNTYLNYFRHNYFGNRAPIDIGHHFSRWNGGAYWKALKRFAKTVCTLPEVRCVTYRELSDYLDSIGSGRISQFQAGQFQKMGKNEVQLPLTTSSASGGADSELNQAELDELIRSLPPVLHDEDKVNQDIEI